MGNSGVWFCAECSKKRSNTLKGVRSVLIDGWFCSEKCIKKSFNRSITKC